MSADRTITAGSALVLALGGDDSEAATATSRRDVVPILLSDVPGLLKHPPASRYESLWVSGGPPEDEIGFGLVSALVIALRPARIALVDTRTGMTRTHSLRGFLAAAAPSSVVQLAASAAAIPAQRLAAATTRASGPPTADRSTTLTRAVYLRGMAGTTTGVGGAVTHTHEVIRALHKQNVEIDAVTTDARIAASAAADPDPPCRWRVLDVPRLFKAIPASTAFGGDVVLARAALTSARSADIVYQRHGRFSLCGALLSRMSGTPLFLEFNGSETFFHEHWQRAPLGGQIAACERSALSAAARIIVVSEVDRRELADRGYDTDRIVVNPNGVDASKFDTGGGAAARAANGLGPEDIVVGFLGSFGPWHGAPLLAQAFGEALVADPRLRLLLIGDGPERRLTEQVLIDAGVRDRARIPGLVANSDVPGYLDACDILAASHVQLPGGAEFFGSPTKLFEYMAAGKAIVASDLGQIGDVLEHEQTAVLVEPGQPSALASAIARLAGDPELRSRLGREARRAAITRHSWDQNATRIVAAYHELVEKGP